MKIVVATTTDTEIDPMLSERFVPLTAQAEMVHRGTVSYASKQQAVANNWQRLEIPRPVT